MRYRWIELVGYGGIYNGMGLNQIKIDFDKCLTNKIVIRGSNGSGKSTLMRSINPLPDSNDCFIPNSEARKNICLTDNGIDYVIRYIHPVTNSGRGTTKGYISKTINGSLVELNPNGNISSCKEILDEELGLDSNFISLSRLSSEDRGLVDSKPAERKKFINAIIDAIETYNGIYKILTKKSSAYKQMINSLTYKIDYLGNELQLKSKLQNIEGRLITLDQEKESTIAAIASVNLKISELVNILRDNNYDTIVTELKDIILHNKNVLNRIINTLNNLEIGYEDGDTEFAYVEQFYNYINMNITIKETEISSLTSRSASLLSQRELEFRDLEDKRLRLNSMQNENNFIDIKTAVENARTTIKEYDDVFKQMGLMNINLISKDEFNEAMESLIYLKTQAGILTISHSVEDLKYVINNFDDVNAKIASISEKKNYLERLKERRNELEKSLAVFTSKQELINQLSNRPTECTIDDCPYIKSAVEASNQYPTQKFLDLQVQLDFISKDIESIEHEIELYSEYELIIDHVNRVKRELSRSMKFINKLPVRQDFEQSFFDRVVALDRFSDIDDLYKFVDCGNMIQEYNIALEQLKKYESEYKYYQAKSDIFDSLTKDINSLIEKTDKLAKEIDEINDNINKTNNEIEGLRSAKIKVEKLLNLIVEDFKPSMARESELQKIKETLDINSTKINELQENLNVLNTNLGAVNNDIKNLNDERESIKHSLLLLEEYKSELDQYSASYNKIEKIRYYSSPSTGIQTLFMQLYMNKIISIANDLLSYLFEGEFVLQPFIINDSEFRIPCLGSGLIHDDISSMSTAQKCMISMILSFSILHQSSSKYNIISLDELDGGLDTNNRSYFIELLDRIMRIMFCEQCFIISHNSELNTASCDLIVLKNNSNEVYQGNIIWQY